MKTQLKLSLLLTAIGMFLNGTVTSQVLKYIPKSFDLVIAGTTNVHDYETKVTSMTGELVMNNPSQVKSFTLNIPVKSIKSKEKLMDTKTYEAFNADKHPTITFRLAEVQSVQTNGSDINLTALGNVTINGTTKRVILKATGKLLTTGTYQFKGSVSMKMTDYGMKPPTAMMGMMKVGDGVTLKYNVTFVEENLLSQLNN
jgi:polyisoprenoid-binding protein YceI